MHHQYMADAIVFGWKSVVSQTCRNWQTIKEQTPSLSTALPARTIWSAEQLAIFPVCLRSQTSYSAYDLYNKSSPTADTPNPPGVIVATSLDCVGPGCPRKLPPSEFNYSRNWRLCVFVTILQTANAIHTIYFGVVNRCVLFHRYADRPNKPGWIATTPNAVLQFNVKFGSAPRLAITFLKSYKSLGEVRCGKLWLYDTIRTLDLLS